LNARAVIKKPEEVTAGPVIAGQVLNPVTVAQKGASRDIADAQFQRFECDSREIEQMLQPTPQWWQGNVYLPGEYLADFKIESKVQSA